MLVRSTVLWGCVPRKLPRFYPLLLDAPRAVSTQRKRHKKAKPSPVPMTETNDVDLSSEIKKSFLSYAMSTILDRALPDVRDGLKPVHRRVLYAMHGLKLTPNLPFRKCARIVGEVLGKYHPHGDLSVYNALVRMTQSFTMGHPLIQGHGNFGSVDNDPAAAMRYTEARMSSFAQDTLFQDIQYDTVDFISNFDGNEVEPVVLPSKVPLMLLNGSTGIAVGLATNIPPHNFSELMRGIIALVKNPNLSFKVRFLVLLIVIYLTSLR